MSAASLGRPKKVTGKPAACQHPPMKQPIEPAPKMAMRGPPSIGLAPPAVGLHSLVRKPEALGGSAALQEDVDRQAAAGVPETADAQPPRFHLGHEPLADPDRYILVESAMIAERA